MSTPEQPDTNRLTRKQMRDQRITPETPVAPSAIAPVTEAAPPAPVPLPRAAEPVPVAEPPVADTAVDLGVAPLTRRQARQQERIRTASVPVITPEVAAAHAAATAAASAPSYTTPPAPSYTPPPTPPAEQTATAALRELFGAPPKPQTIPGAPAAAPAQPVYEPVDVEPEESDAPPTTPAWAPASTQAWTPAWTPEADDADDSSEEDAFASLLIVADDEDEAPAVVPVTSAPAEDEPSDSSSDRAVLNPMFGAGLIAGGSNADLPPSFDQLLSRPGGVATANTLIVPSTGDSPIIAPVTATGDVLITGTLNLPEGLGSTGHSPGTADGKEVDAVLVDGELPAHSSPTPIAASAAISTVKSAGDVIKPPTPEKGSKLMMTLAITAGVLALALVGVLILAFVTGVF